MSNFPNYLRVKLQHLKNLVITDKIQILIKQCPIITDMNLLFVHNTNTNINTYITNTINVINFQKKSFTNTFHQAIIQKLLHSKTANFTSKNHPIADQKDETCCDTKQNCLHNNNSKRIITMPIKDNKYNTSIERDISHKLPKAIKGNLIGNDKNIIIDNCDHKVTNNKELKEGSENTYMNDVIYSENENGKVRSKDKDDTMSTTNSSPNVLHDSYGTSRVLIEKNDYKAKSENHVQPNYAGNLRLEYEYENVFDTNELTNRNSDMNRSNNFYAYPEKSLNSMHEIEKAENGYISLNKKEIGNVTDKYQKDMEHRQNNNEHNYDSQHGTISGKYKDLTNQQDDTALDWKDAYCESIDYPDNSLDALIFGSEFENAKRDNQFNKVQNSKEDDNNGNTLPNLEQLSQNSITKAESGVYNNVNNYENHMAYSSSSSIVTDQGIADIFSDGNELPTFTYNKPYQPETIDDEAYPDKNKTQNDTSHKQSVIPCINDQIESKSINTKSQTISKETESIENIPDISIINSNNHQSQTIEIENFAHTIKKEINKGMEEAEIENIESFPIDDKNNDDDFDRIFEEEFDAVMNEDDNKSQGKKKQGPTETDKLMKSNEISEYIKQKNINNRINTANAFLGVKDRFARYANEDIVNPEMEIIPRESNKSEERIINQHIKEAPPPLNIEDIRRPVINHPIFENVIEKPKQGKMLHEFKRMQDYVTHPTQRSHIYYVQNIDKKNRINFQGGNVTNVNTNEYNNALNTSMQSINSERQGINNERQGINNERQRQDTRRASYERDDTVSMKQTHKQFPNSKEIREKVANVQLYGNSIGYPGNMNVPMQNHMQPTFVRKSRSEVSETLRPKMESVMHINYPNYAHKSSYTHMAHKGLMESTNNRLGYLNQTNNRMPVNINPYKSHSFPPNYPNKRYKIVQDGYMNVANSPEQKSKSVVSENGSNEMHRNQRQHIKGYNTMHQPEKYARTYPPQNNPSQYHPNTNFIRKNNYHPSIYPSFMSQNQPNKGTNYTNTGNTNKNMRNANMQNIANGYLNQSPYNNNNTAPRSSHVNSYMHSQNNNYVQKGFPSSSHYMRNANYQVEKNASGYADKSVNNYMDKSVNNYMDNTANSYMEKNNKYGDSNNYTDKNVNNYGDKNVNNYDKNVNMGAYSNMESRQFVNHYGQYDGKDESMKITRGSREETSQGIDYSNTKPDRRYSVNYTQNNKRLHDEDSHKQKNGNYNLNIIRRGSDASYNFKFDNVYSNFNSNNSAGPRDVIMDVNMKDVERFNAHVYDSTQTQQKVVPPENKIHMDKNIECTNDPELKRRVTSNSLFPHNSPFNTAQTQDTKEFDELNQKITNMSYTPLDLSIEEIVFVKAKINNSRRLFDKLNYLMNSDPVDTSILKIYNTLILQKEAFEKEIYFLKINDIDSMAEEINKKEELKKKENPNDKQVEYDYNNNGKIWATKKIAKNFEDQKRKNKEYEMKMSEKKDFDDEIEATYDYDLEYDDL